MRELTNDQRRGNELNEIYEGNTFTITYLRLETILVDAKKHVPHKRDSNYLK